jgi:endonuclease/exonuclease/phosphatase family metal-dependent hydrolase
VKAGTSSVRLVSYNVRYFGHALKGLASTRGAKAAIAESLADLTPLADLIALQEVETRSLRADAAHRGSTTSLPQLERFMVEFESALRLRGVASPYQAFHFPAHAYRLGPLRLYTTGLAILVNSQRLHVVEGNVRAPQPITHHHSERLRRIKQTRIAAHLRLETTDGATFHVFNTHLSLPTPWAKEFWSQPDKMGHGANQLAEATSVASYAAQIARNEPYLLVGDFNSAPATPVYQRLTQELGLKSAQAALNVIDLKKPKAFPTAGFLRLRMHLDHVFGQHVQFENMNGTFAFGATESPFHGLSDHVPLVVQLLV